MGTHALAALCVVLTRAPLFVCPLSDIRINSVDNTLTLTYLGVITQSTEEDWKDTRLVR